jgi:hypothetical protein
MANLFGANDVGTIVGGEVVPELPPQARDHWREEIRHARRAGDAERAIAANTRHQYGRYAYALSRLSARAVCDALAAHARQAHGIDAEPELVAWLRTQFPRAAVPDDVGLDQISVEMLAAESYVDMSTRGSGASEGAQLVWRMVDNAFRDFVAASLARFAREADIAWEPFVDLALSEPDDPDNEVVVIELSVGDQTVMLVGGRHTYRPADPIFAMIGTIWHDNILRRPLAGVRVLEEGRVRVGIDLSQSDAQIMAKHGEVGLSASIFRRALRGLYRNEADADQLVERHFGSLEPGTAVLHQLAETYSAASVAYYLIARMVPQWAEHVAESGYLEFDEYVRPLLVTYADIVESGGGLGGFHALWRDRHPDLPWDRAHVMALAEAAMAETQHASILRDRARDLADPQVLADPIKAMVVHFNILRDSVFSQRVEEALRQGWSTVVVLAGNVHLHLLEQVLRARLEAQVVARHGDVRTD